MRKNIIQQNLSLFFRASFGLSFGLLTGAL
jgi:hypothetical protein